MLPSQVTPGPQLPETLTFKVAEGGAAWLVLVCLEGTTDELEWAVTEDLADGVAFVVAE